MNIVLANKKHIALLDKNRLAINHMQAVPFLNNHQFLKAMAMLAVVVFRVAGIKRKLGLLIGKILTDF
ncbi:hypothetical protein D3C75_683260 [compost metagenome]